MNAFSWLELQWGKFPVTSSPPGIFLGDRRKPENSELNHEPCDATCSSTIPSILQIRSIQSFFILSNSSVLSVFRIKPLTNEEDGERAEEEEDMWHKPQSIEETAVIQKSVIHLIGR